MSIRDVLLQITALPTANCSASSPSEADRRREAGCMKWNRRFTVLYSRTSKVCGYRNSTFSSCDLWIKTLNFVDFCTILILVEFLNNWIMRMC